ncbi:TlpA disulfide reductase family protein [Maribellus mangrovi]|uniref:TlpA disulfide reductase family protein n=1 Tax=Maribellus mangrovi TaxID=3133146 RepID=UPI0030EE0114
MKKYFVLILGVALFACTRQSGFKIDVNLEGAEGKVVLEERKDGAWVGVDTADVVDGSAILEGEVEVPGAYYLSVLGQRAKALIFVENAKMSVSGKADSISFADVRGSVAHDEYAELSDKLKKISDEYMALYQQARTADAEGDTAKSAELMAQVEEMYESTNTLQEDFVKEHPASYVTPVILNNIQYGKEAAELEEMVTALDPKIQEVPSVVTLKEKIEKLKKVAVGQIAPDFTQNDPEGNPVKFSDVYSQNELTLLDFWASWCGPCRRENPNVVAVYDEFHDKGFTVFGVSLDRDKEAWLKGIEDDGLTWTQVSDLAYWNNEVAQAYAVSSIPHSILIGKDGTIIAKNKRGDELREAVQEYLAN